MEEPLTGYHSIEEALKSADCSGTLYIARQNRRIQELEKLARTRKVPVVTLSPGELDLIAKGFDHRGACLILLKREREKPLESLSQLLPELEGKDRIVLVLDGITDPHNFGAILRSAEQFAADLVIYQERHSAGRSEAVSRTSAGAVHHIKLLCVTNLVRTLMELKDAGFWIFGTSGEGKRIHQTNLRGRIALVMGSEGSGIRRLVREKCDFFVSIPTTGQIDSLNVSVAAGIVLYEARRQRFNPTSSAD